MSKFNRDMISGMGKGLQIGAGLLSEESKKLATPREEDVYLLHVSDIEPNPKNTMSQGRIEEMAELIRLAGGIEQNLVGYRLDNGKVRLTSGERRYRGAKWLLENEGKEYLLPVKIKDYRQYDLPLDDDMKEQFAIHVTNAYRVKTDADKLEEVKFWSAFSRELRKKGIKVLEIRDENNEVVVSQQIEGKRTREIISEQTGMKPTQVGKFEAMLQPQNTVLATAILDGKLDLAGAEALKELPQDDQKKFLEKNKKNTGEALQGRDVKKMIREEQEEGKRICLKLEDFQADMNKMSEAFSGDILEMTDSDYRAYRKCIEKLKKIMQIEGE